MMDKPNEFISTPQSPLVEPKILQQLSEEVVLSPSYLVLMGMAGILSAIALLTNSIPILIGSMIIAPAFLPLSLVAFALVAGQPRLALRGFMVALVGLFVATISAMATVWVFNTSDILPSHDNLLDKPLLEERVEPGWYSVVVALAAGVSGTIALVKQKVDTLVGTVAALALVPAAAAAAIAFMSHDPLRGVGGLELLAINVGLIILAGMITVLMIGSEASS
ncbi:MAG: DUF389 domain-containing protein [Coleofasciculus chthonoplastes F3-SA18-01]|jgi:uncharacterized hydrophobic protein (TIGR00271 family)|uniref:DUF389 domain-containing protein n=1 Tax=Coleofasciculus chthonoplastes TaxID=64178 RepID=UPI0032FA2064